MPKLQNTERYILMEMDERVSSFTKQAFSLQQRHLNIFMILGERRISPLEDGKG